MTKKKEEFKEKLASGQIEIKKGKIIDHTKKEDEETELSESFNDSGAIGLPPNEGTAAFRKMFK